MPPASLRQARGDIVHHAPPASAIRLIRRYDLRVATGRKRPSPRTAVQAVKAFR